MNDGKVHVFENNSALGKLTDILKMVKNASKRPFADELQIVINNLECEFFVRKNPYKNISKEFFDIFSPSDNNINKPALVFGAGISMGPPFNMCNWSGLLKNAVAGHFLAQYGSADAYTDMKSFLGKYGDFLGKYDLYELAQYIENSIRERHATDKLYSSDEIERRVNADMYEIVKRSIYYGKDRVKMECADDELKKSLLYRLCDYVHRKNIGRVLTYNYDNAFEYAYDKYQADSKRTLTPVFIDNQLPFAEDYKSVCSYHVHGYVPYFTETYSEKSEIVDALKKDEAKRLILSEYSYDDMAHSGYKWRNTLQIDTFLKYNCLFFGFSATDKNFKRIVKLMGWRNEGSVFDEEHEAKHYIFMTIDDYIKNIFGELAPIVFNDKSKKSRAKKKLKSAFENQRDDLLKALIVQCRLMCYTLRSRRKYLKGLNIYPIWCTTFDVVDCFDYMLSGE